MKKILMTILGAGFAALCVHAQGIPATPILCPTTLDGTPWTPSWANAPGKLYTVCPENVKVGIGTDQPRSALDVSGTTYTGRLAVGIDPTNMIGRFHLKALGLSPANNSVIF